MTTAPEPQPAQPWEIPHLTRREREVLSLIAEGLTDKEIADRMFIGLRCAHFHAYNVRHKLGVHNRIRAIIAARRLGILTEEGR
jgi:DNA-binding NarL/FixJ family response regulator